MNPQPIFVSMNRLSPVLLFFLFAYFALLVPSALAQTPSQSSSPGAADIRNAMMAMGQGDTAGARVILDSLVAVHPESAPAWNALGMVTRRAGDHEASLSAFESVESINPGSGPTAFNIGVAHAFLSHVDSAFEWLQRAKDSGTVLTPNIALSPAAAALRSDPRWSSLFPAPSEYAEPFVEDREILQDWYGETAGDVFGWIARNIGDVDGDGIADITTSATGFNSQSGKVYVYSGGSGVLLWSVSGSIPGGRLGHGIESAGDVNADGIPDVVAAAPYINEVRVFSGDDGTELFSVAGADTSGAFGLSVKGLGDINGDGHSDLLIGEPFQVWGAPINGGDLSRPGRAHIISGADASTLAILEGDAPGDGFGSSVSGRVLESGGYRFIVGAPGGGEAGTGMAWVFDSLEGPLFTAEPDAGAAQFASMFLSVVGDLNADGTEDIYIADWGDNAAAPGAGKIYLYSGTDGDRLFAIEGEAAGDGYGIGIADAGDVDRDGYDDLIVGAWQHASAAPSGGKLYVHSGRDASLLFEVTGSVAGETLGFDTTGVGDINGDGWVDFLVTSAYSMRHGFRTGRTLILSGKPSP